MGGEFLHGKVLKNKGEKIIITLYHYGGNARIALAVPKLEQHLRLFAGVEGGNEHEETIVGHYSCIGDGVELVAHNRTGGE